MAVGIHSISKPRAEAYRQLANQEFKGGGGGRLGLPKTPTTSYPLCTHRHKRIRQRQMPRATHRFECPGDSRVESVALPRTLAARKVLILICPAAKRQCASRCHKATSAPLPLRTWLQSHSLVRIICVRCKEGNGRTCLR